MTRADARLEVEVVRATAPGLNRSDAPESGMSHETGTEASQRK